MPKSSPKPAPKPRPFHHARTHWKKGALVGAVVVAAVISACHFLRQPNGSPLRLDQPEAAQLDLLAKQEQQAKDDWQAAAAALAAAEENGDTTQSGSQAPEGLEKQLRETTAALLASRNELQAHEKQIASLQQQLAGNPAAAEGAAVGTSASEAKEAIELLEAQEKDLADRFTDSHPKLTAVRQQIADLRAALASLPQGVPAGQPDSPERQALAQSLASAQKQAAALRDKERALERQQQELRAALTAEAAENLAARANASLASKQLEERLQVAETKHRAASQRLAEAQAAAIMNPKQEVSQASAATKGLSLTPEVGVLAGLLGIASAAATMMLTAQLNRRVTTRKQLAALWDLPIIGTVPSGGIQEG